MADIPLETLNYVWTRRAALRPSLMSVGWVRGPMPPRRISFCFANWVMNYSYTFAPHRAGGKRAPWTMRPPNSLYLYPPHFTFWEDTRRDHGPRHGSWILLNEGEVAGLDGYLHPLHGYASFEDPGNRLGSRLERIALIGAHQGEAGFWDAQALMCEMIGLLGRTRRTSEETYRLDPEGVPAPITLAVQVERLLAANLAKSLSVSAISHQCAMSKSTFYRKLQAETNETVSQMHARLRIAEVKRLLLRGKTLQEIAARTGFCDAFHLSTTFKRIEGVSPREFKKMIK